MYFLIIRIYDAHLENIVPDEIVQTQRTVDSVVGPSKIKCAESQGIMQISGWRVGS